MSNPSTTSEERTPPTMNAGGVDALAWPSSVQISLAVLVLVGMLVLVGKSLYDWGYASGVASARPLVEEPFASLDLNRATFAELRTLPGLGETLARRVLEERDRKGPFSSFADLRRVAGIGPKTLDRLRPYLHVQGSIGTQEPIANVAWNSVAPPVTSAPNEGRISKYPSSTKDGELSEASIELNSANSEDLQRLPGIGVVLAQRIVNDRKVRGDYKSVEELRRVPGIGMKTLEKLRPFAKVEAKEKQR